MTGVASRSKHIKFYHLCNSCKEEAARRGVVEVKYLCSDCKRKYYKKAKETSCATANLEVCESIKKKYADIKKDLLVKFKVHKEAAEKYRQEIVRIEKIIEDTTE